jgi:hypothetical protein
MGFVVATHSRIRPAGDWAKHKRWYAVLHLFEPNGRHIQTKHWFSGTTADGEDTVCSNAKSELKRMIAEFGDVEFKDVAVRLFEIEIEGRRFGLIADEERGTVSLEPNDFLFRAPWNGEYDT